MRRRHLADVPGGYTDELYTGDTGEGALSLQNYRNKVREFQVTLEALDQGAAAARLALDATEGSGDFELASYLFDWLSDFESKAFVMRATAQTINAGAAAFNAAGGRFPVLSIPSGLGVIPVALGLAAVAAIATAATLITWGTTALRGLNERLLYSQSLEAITDPDQRARLAEATALSANALRTAEASPLSSLATIIKWGAVGFAAFLAFRAFQTSRA